MVDHYLDDIMKHKQQDLTDCGPACLSSIFSYYGLHLPIAQIRYQASTDTKGTNLLGLQEACNHFGFDAIGIKANYEYLHQINKPVVAHLIRKQLQHFVVIYTVKDDMVKIMDPEHGHIKWIKKNCFLPEWSGVILEITKNEHFSSADHRKPIYKRYQHILNPHKKDLLTAFLISLLFTLLGLSTALFIQFVIDDILPGGSSSELLLISSLMILIILIQLFAGYFRSKLMLRIGLQIDQVLLCSFIGSLLRLQKSFFDRMRNGEILSRFSDAIKIRVFISDIAMNLILNCVILISAFALMMFSQLKLGLLILTILPLYGLILLFFNKKNKVNQKEVMRASADLESILVETVENIELYKLFGQETDREIRVNQSIEKLLTKGYTSGQTQVLTQLSTTFLNRSFVVFLIGFGGFMIMNNHLSLGELMAFYTLIGYFTQPVSELINSNQRYQDAVIATRRLFDIQDLPSERGRLIQNRKLHKVSRIDFQKVVFSYGASRNVLDDFSIRIGKGELHSIIGESGSGKSTIAQLCINLYPVKSGIIRLNGLDINSYDLSEIRNSVATVSQNVQIVSGSIRDNILFGSETESDTHMIRICSKLGLHTFIEKLPFKYDTLIGENGLSLSGGQSQLISIARALNRKPDILILDEPTSALDARSAEIVLKALQSLRDRGMGILMISHRMKSCMISDRISVVESGKIIESGSHSDLFKVGTRYFEMWKQQSPFMSEFMKMSA